MVNLPIFLLQQQHKQQTRALQHKTLQHKNIKTRAPIEPATPNETGTTQVATGVILYELLVATIVVPNAVKQETINTDKNHKPEVTLLALFQQ